MIDIFDTCPCSTCHDLIHRSYHERACFICGNRGACVHREPEVEQAYIDARLARVNRALEQAPECPPAGVRRKPARTLRVVGSPGKASNHD